MSCHVCSRPASSRLPFYCSTCVLNKLYLLRYENARVLLEKDAVGREIELAVGHSDVKEIPRDADDGESQQNLRWKVQAAQTEQARSSDRIQMIRARTEALKAEIRDKKADVKQRTVVLEQRRSDAESANYQLAERRDSALSNIQNSIKRTEHLWHSLHNKTAESRIFLCREAANLYGLRQKLRKRDKVIVESYVIGGVPIMDLRDLNGTNHHGFGLKGTDPKRRYTLSDINGVLEHCPSTHTRVPLSFSQAPCRIDTAPSELSNADDIHPSRFVLVA
jgi:hypothetical protein